ncbi:MAG: corrinoid protein [Lachnospiraceae bacterium]|nr:corrinoid protein [Lachnospiraceae bacterium]
MSKIDEIASMVERGKTKLVPGLVEEAIEEGFDPVEILNKGMIDAMGSVGEKFQKNEIFVPEMLVAAKAMKKGVETLKPYLGSDTNVTIGKAAVGTVQGDLHDIGKNLVCLMLESAGFEVNDLGVDVSKEKFAEAAADPEVKIIGVSALLTTTMPAMRDTVALLNTLPNRANFKVMVGGAPITAEFAEEIGADAYTTDAASCASVAKAFVVG